MTTYSAKNVTVSQNDAEAVFTVIRTGTQAELNEPSSVDFETRDNTAEAGQDYVATSGTLSYGAGETSQTASVVILAEAFEQDGREDFMFVLSGFGAATCHISKSASSDAVQSYWFVSGSGTSITIPTSETAAQPLISQVEATHLTAPPNGGSSMAMPKAYLRIGSARADVNFTERIIMDSNPYQAALVSNKETGEIQRDGDGSPAEFGANEHFGKPRAVTREDGEGNGLSEEELADLMENNAHLDGMFLYSDKAYVQTVKGNASTVIQGDSHTHFGGQSRTHFSGHKIESISDEKSGNLLLIAGMDDVAGQPTNYAFTTTRQLDVAAAQTNTYSMSTSFTARFAAAANLSFAIDLNIRQGASMDIDGGTLSASFNAAGEYSVAKTGEGICRNLGRATTRVKDRILLSVSPVKYAAAAGYAGLGLSAAALGLSASVAGVAGSSLKWSTNKWISPDRIENDHLGNVLAAGFPATAGAIGAVGLALAIALVVAQRAEELLPDPTEPRVELSPGRLKLSVGLTTSLEMTPASIVMNAPSISLFAQQNLMTTAKSHVALWNNFGLVSDKVRFAVADFNHVGNLSFAGNAVMNGPVDASVLNVGP